MELRRRVHAGLNKGEARNALVRAVFFNLVTAAFVLLNTVYLELAAYALRGNGHAVDDVKSDVHLLTPTSPHHLRLLQHQLHRSLLQVRWVLVLAKNALDHQAQLGSYAFAF